MCFPDTMELEQKAEYTYWNETGVEHRELMHILQYVGTLADLHSVASRHLLSVGQLQLW